MKKIIFYLFITTLHFQIAFGQQVNRDDDGILKILAIGNSFSEDALENYLHELAAAADKKIIIGNLYIGGASLELHMKNINADKASYSYRKIALDGIKTTTKNVSISETLKDENWDYVSLQQASPYSGQYDIIMESLPALLDYVKGAVSPDAKIVYHQTWAYQHDSKHEGFKNYDKNQMAMYKAILTATKKIHQSKKFAFVTPAGTAIQNARTSSIGDQFTRDGFHLNLAYGRFTAACTWYEKLFGLDVRENSYKPENITELQDSIAKNAAHKAVKKPFKISKIKL
ncbi:DUF4886 domain-containing protein [Sphingobacterium pedocola]|uniref:DUF4886 domain-containing protein n=1 Tax=Sphingobacterium pedocola TaxID=2082722 RepID=A0ABR9T304_9SPHI|nr:DUF4886 domain-containing protein [Sphingobacterium pedocola]MBE8719721.1 DUF4886 domain-containing protein [Sphingobacterium pedocola]